MRCVSLLTLCLIPVVAGQFRRLSHPCAPTQIHLAVGQDPSSEMTISFSTAFHRRCKDAQAFVLLNEKGSSLKWIVKEKESPNQYNYTSSRDASHYTSANFHHIKVKGLKADTTYYYICNVKIPHDLEDVEESSIQVARRLGEDVQEVQTQRSSMQSKVSFFHTAPAVGTGLGNLKFAFVGDLGLKKASKATIHHMSRDEEIDTILLVGDVSYANTRQSVWDDWFDMMEHLIRQVPLQTAPGNHEIEVDGKSHEIYVPFDNRFSMPEFQKVIKSPSRHATFSGGRNLPYDYGNAYFAYTYGAARFIILCSFTSSAHNSSQYYWLKKELQSIDRAATPWVFVAFHVPLYNTFGSHNPSKSGEEMKENLEDLFVYYRVNVVFSGHVHAYMRSKNVAHGVVNKQAPVYIIIGDGGFGNGARYGKGPVEDWVAKRENSTHGFGTLELLNATHAHWKWVRNVNEHFTKIHDSAIIRNQYLL